MRTAAPALFAVLSVICACLPAGAGGEERRVWQGRVEVLGQETIPPDTVLIVMPGTEVTFSHSGTEPGGLVVEGRIVAAGTEEEPITFAASSDGSWSEIRIESGKPSRFAHCRFRKAGTALHSHLTPLKVRFCRFEKNGVAVRFRGDPVELVGNEFAGNGTAVRYWESSPAIVANSFRGNGTGIFCREGSPGTVVEGNNFHDSVDYHIKLGELQEGDVEAGSNFWGTLDRDRIEEKLFDRRDVSYLGRVLFDPPAPDPFPPPGTGDALPAAAGRGADE